MGGGKGGGAEIPAFVKEAQKLTGERAKQLYDVSSPIMKEGVGQIQSLMTTGGPGAQVPIIANMEEGSRRAFNVANRQIEEQMSRGGGGLPRDPSLNRISELQNIEHQAALKSIAPSIAAPFISGGMGAALGGAGNAQAGYQAAGQALASGIRRPQQKSGGGDIMGAFSQLGQMYASGGFGGGGKAGGSNMPTGPSQNIWSGGPSQLTFGGGF